MGKYFVVFFSLSLVDCTTLSTTSHTRKASQPAEIDDGKNGNIFFNSFLRISSSSLSRSTSTVKSPKSLSAQEQQLTEHFYVALFRVAEEEGR